MRKDSEGTNNEAGADIDPNPVCNIDSSLIRGNISSPEQLCVMGMEQYDDGHLLKAIQCYMTALSLKPDFIPALLGATCVLVAMERYPEAQTYLDYVFELDPDIKDAKLLRNIINNAQSGYPVFEQTQEMEESSEVDEYIIPPEPSLFKRVQPYLIGALVLTLCYMLSGPYLWGKKPEAKTPDIAEIRKSLASEPVLKNAAIKADIKGEEIFLSGQVPSQAERRLAMVISEQAGEPLKVDASKLKIGTGSPEVKQAVKPETKPETKPEAKTQNNKKNYYTVQKGDILSQIARNKYGDGKYWTKIQAANPGLLNNPEDLSPGMVIVLPD